jgi:hypothetical protein
MLAAFGRRLRRDTFSNIAVASGGRQVPGSQLLLAGVRQGPVAKVPIALKAPWMRWIHLGGFVG